MVGAATVGMMETVGMVEEEIEVVESRGPEGFGFFVKVRSSGQVYRVAPARDPHQPRFWCLLVTRCSSAGVADPGERPWLGAGGMTREELPTTLAAIRDNVGDWLAQDSCQELRRWLVSAVPIVPPAALATRRSASQAATEVAAAGLNGSGKAGAD